MIKHEAFFTGQIAHRLTTENLPVEVYVPSFAKYIDPEPAMRDRLVTNDTYDIAPALFADSDTLTDTLKYLEMTLFSLT